MTGDTMSDDMDGALGMSAEDAAHDADCEHFREAAMLAARVMQAEVEVDRLRAERDRERERADRAEGVLEEVEHQVLGGSDVDGPVVSGLDGLSLPSKVNVLHSTAVDATVRVYELEQGIREHSCGIALGCWCPELNDGDTEHRPGCTGPRRTVQERVLKALLDSDGDSEGGED